MFRNPFGFEGRIRRTEYILSVLIVVFYIAFLESFANILLNDTLLGPFVLVLGILPCSYFLLAQGIKRCHDINLSGFFILIPGIFLWLLFDDSRLGPNNYGPYPKHDFLPGTQVKIVSSRPQNVHTKGYVLEWEKKWTNIWVK